MDCCCAPLALALISVLVLLAPKGTRVVITRTIRESNDVR